jgi:mannose-6-phosphate isomerase-like protein (cupin superfamily)
MSSARDDLAGGVAHAPIVGSAIDDLPQIWDGFAKLVRAGLDIRGFGAQIMDMPPGHVTKSHDESETGQQELYVALRGSGEVVAGDQRFPLDAEHLVRVDAGVDRVLTAGADGLRVLCVGGVPGAPYVAPEWTNAE